MEELPKITLFKKFLNSIKAEVVDGKFIWRLDDNVSPTELFKMVDEGITKINKSETLDNH